MQHKPEEIPCETPQELFDILDNFEEKYKKYCDYDNWYFRGQSGDWPLIPSAFRPSNKELLNDLYLRDRPHKRGQNTSFTEYERNIIRIFLQLADEEGAIIYWYTSEFKEKYLSLDWTATGGREPTKHDIWAIEYRDSLALAQHYGIPTRLLDWTKSSEVAAYFSSSKAENNETGYCVIWAFMYGEKRSFGNDYDTKFHLVDPPKGNNHNLRSQKGVFTLVENDHMDENVWIDHYLGEYLKKIKYPARYSEEVLDILKKRDIDESNLSPFRNSDESRILKNVARQIRSKSIF